MSDLTFLERNKLEKLFEMEGGYVLSFTNRSLEEFVADTVQKDIYSTKYDNASGSKANRLRAFWKVESNHVVGQLTAAMIDFTEAGESNPPDADLVHNCRKVAARLLEGAPVPNIDAISPNSAGRTFESLAKTVREAIENNEPELGLDRLHTFVVKYIRNICKEHGISEDREKPLHSCFGEYVKFLRTSGYIASEMTERILKTSISVLEAFNHVRNNNSFAHDNELLSYDEALLIFNDICSLIRFLESIEESIARKEL